ncbi:MAG: DUF2269 domain-containing protein [Actinomycetota bacterium]|nr:DUF2269 domain-containing protein [Actinomycetota bacterium]
MSYYNVLLFVHIAAAVVWIGGGTALTVLGSRFARVRDSAGLEGLFRQSAWLSSRIFTPASLVVLVAGILLVIEGPWSFGDLWIVLGLAGLAVTFLTGLLFLLPRAKAINATLESSGRMTDEAAEATRRLFVLTRIDYTALFLIVAAMALKPTTEDVWTLVAMAAVLVASAALVTRDLRGTDRRRV